VTIFYIYKKTGFACCKAGCVYKRGFDKSNPYFFVGASFMKSDII